MSTVNVGTLAGKIEFEDRVTATMSAILDKVEKLESKFGGLDTSVKSVAGGFILAETAIKAASVALDLGVQLVKDFTTEGAAIADVEDSFNRLTESAGRSGETMLGVLAEGTRNTIDDFTLMTTVNDQFAAGIQLTDEQMKTLAEGGFALAQAKGMDVAKAFDIVNNAMLTGSVRSVQLLTGKIDLSKAEEDYAKSLGTTSDRLTAVEKQEAAREAILQKLGEATERLGEQTDGVDEIIAQVQTSWNNFYNDLIKGVAASPQVVAMFVEIRDSVFEAFGGSNEAILDNFMSVINDVADTVTSAVPTVIDWLVRAKDTAVAFYGGAVRAWETFGPVIMKGFSVISSLVMGVYDAVVGTWNALPDWLKTVAERSALTAAGLYLVAEGASSLADNLISMGANFATITSGLKDFPDLFGRINKGVHQLGILWAVLDFSSLAQAGASLKLVAGSVAGLIGPLGIATLYAGALYAAFELGKWEPISDFFFELGLELQGFTQAEQDAMIAAEKAVQAQLKQTDQTKQQVEVQNLLDEVQAKINASTEQLTNNLNTQSDVLGGVNDRTKEYALAWEALNDLGTTYQDVLMGVNENLRASVMEYAELGATVEDLYQAFPQLTKAQAEAAVAAAKAAEEIKKVNLETFQIIAAAQGDNINDWIEGERRKLEATLKSLELQGQLTTEMLDAQMAKFNATIDAEIAKRNEANEFSKAYYQKQVDDAQAALDLIMLDTSQYTEEAIRQAYRLLEDRKRTLEQWTAHANGAITSQTELVVTETARQVEAIEQVNDAWMRGVDAIVDGVEMVRTLSGEMITLEEKAKRMGGTFTNDIQPLTRTQIRDIQSDMGEFGGGDPTSALMRKLDELLDREGTYAPKNREQYLSMINDQVLLSQLKMWFQQNNIDIPSFRDGGVGDFGSGTMAMLHGPEAIVPLDKMGGLGGVTNTFYVNGTGADVARVVSDILMQQLKSSRQFGSV